MFPCMAMSPIVMGFDVEAALIRARLRAEMKHEVMALLMGISSQQLSQQLARRGGYVSLPRVLSLAETEEGRLLLRYFWSDVADYLGIEDRDSVALQLAQFKERFQALIDKMQVRMLNAQFPARAKEKAS